MIKIPFKKKKTTHTHTHNRFIEFSGTTRFYSKAITIGFLKKEKLKKMSFPWVFFIFLLGIVNARKGRHRSLVWGIDNAKC